MDTLRNWTISAIESRAEKIVSLNVNTHWPISISLWVVPFLNFLSSCWPFFSIVPEIIPRKRTRPTFLFDLNFSPQSSGLLISSVQTWWESRSPTRSYCTGFFLQSRIGVKKRVLHRDTIKVCVSLNYGCFWQNLCSVSYPCSSSRSNARGKVKGPWMALCQLK